MGCLVYRPKALNRGFEPGGREGKSFVSWWARIGVEGKGSWVVTFFTPPRSCWWIEGIVIGVEVEEEEKRWRVVGGPGGDYGPFYERVACPKPRSVQATKTADHFGTFVVLVNLTSLVGL